MKKILFFILSLTCAVSYGQNAYPYVQRNGALTSGRVPFATTNGILLDSANMTFNSGAGALTATSFSGLLNSSALTLSGVASPAYAQGKLVYDTDNESLTFFNNDSGIGLQVGQEFWLRVRNDTGSTITNGSAVYISGAASGLPQISLANASSGATATAIGLTTESIATATSGWVTTQGLVHGLDTSAFSTGARVYLGTTNGTLTATAPSNPNYQVTIGTVIVSNASTGSISVGASSGRIAGNLAFTDVANIFTAPQTFTTAARASGVAPYFTVNIPTDTGITAATEGPGFKSATATRTWATTGTVALQRENYWAGPTYASAGASQTFTDAFTAYFDRPIAGTNAIFTRGHTLGIVDSTSAASSITGGLVVATTLGTTATSVGIGGGNVNAGGLITGGTMTSTGAFTASSTSTFTGVATHNNAVVVNGAAGSTALTITNTARTSGILPYIKYTIPTDTAQTAATESPGIVGVTGTRTWATTGTVGLQREIFFPGPTYASASASQTFTDAFNMYLTPPVAGTNAIFTRGHTLGIVDSTSAASSITGGLVISTTLGTTATSVGIGAGNVNAGAAITAPSLVSTGTVTLFSSATPTTTAAQMAFDNNAWATSFGAVQVHNGTANTFLVGTEASDTPTNGQVPTWNTGGTITWETPSGSGTVTTTGTMTTSAIVASNGTTVIKTPSATATIDSSGNISTPGTLTVGNAATTAGAVALTQGTTQSTGTTNITIQAPTSVTSYIRTLPSAVGSTGVVIETVSGSTQTESVVTTLPSALTIPAPVFSTGATASGSGSYDLSGSSGSFKTQTGAGTIGPGALTFSGIPTFTATARSSGAASYFTLTTPADTNQTLSTEVIGANFTAATRQWATGALTTQRERVFAAPTYGFVGASTLTTAVNVDIADPIAGTNATLTNKYGLRVNNQQITGTLTANTGTNLIGPLVDSVDGTTPLNNILTTIAAGTAYTLTASNADVTFGTTSPTVTLANAGTYMLVATIQTSLVGATYAAAFQTVSYNFRRTNNTAADLSGSTFLTTLNMVALTTQTIPGPVITINLGKYVTTNITDIIGLRGVVSATPAAGSVTCSNATITAIRLY